MTFAQFETSQQGSRPIELYEITQGSDVYYWTSSEDEVTVGGKTYDPVAGLKRGKVGDGQDERKALLEIELPASNAFARKYVATVPGAAANFRLLRVQRTDLPTPGVVVLFRGLVASVAFTENNRVAKIAVEPSIVALVRQIPRWTFQGSCNWVLGDEDTCKVDLTDPAFHLDGTVSAIDGSVITVPGAAAFGAGWFEAGFVAGLGYDYRMVTDHTGDDLTLLLPFPQNMVGQDVLVVVGCDHSPEGAHGCGPKFNNGDNYGGWFSIPDRNPFKGQIP